MQPETQSLPEFMEWKEMTSLVGSIRTRSLVAHRRRPAGPAWRRGRRSGVGCDHLPAYRPVARLIRDQKRHPTIGDRVTIYAGAVILGGDTYIRDDAVIAGGVFLTKSVAEGTNVRQKAPELIHREPRK